MAEHFSQVFFPTSFQELFSAWNRFPDAVLFAGGTEHVRNQFHRVLVLPQNIISLDKLQELARVSRTERYLEIGAMVKLNQIIQLGRTVPEVLTRCIECIAGPQLRNQATIGGNICHSLRRLDCTAPMIALDAQYELRTALSSRWITAARFSSMTETNLDSKVYRKGFSSRPALATQELLTRIRVPLEPWDFTWYRKFRTSGNNEPGGGILFMIRNQKNILTDIRVIYSDQTILREKDSETMLIDKHLPLERKDAVAFVEKWRNYLSLFKGNYEYVLAGESGKTDPELTKVQILNFIETTINHISD